MTYDQVKDIVPVIIIARVPNLFSVTNSLPVKSVAELIAYAKAKPGELFYGTPGLGSHRACLDRTVQVDDRRADDARALQGQRAGADRPDRRPRAPDHRQSAGLAEYAEAGSIRAIAVSTAKRWPLLPDLPTIAEAGVPGYEAASWFTIGAPAKTPKEIIVKLNASVDKFSRPTRRSPGCASSAPSRPAARRRTCSAYVLAETEKWGKVAKFAGIKPE